MKSEEQVKRDLVNKLREQADRLERGTPESIMNYKTVRLQIEVLENILCLDTFNDTSAGAAELFKDRKD